MPEDMFDTVIVRFSGEIGIKAPMTRKQYERRLTTNIKAALKHYAIPYSTFNRKPGRLYIKTHQAEKAAKQVRRVFGVQSLSPAIETSSNLDDILGDSLKVASSKFVPGKSFAVRCHRVGNHRYTSQDICTSVGEHFRVSLPKLKLRVDLEQPKQTLHVEIRDEKAYLFIHIVKGPGGLPLGTQPKLICLLKGDAESTVACWMTMKRGCPPIFVHIANSITERQENSNEVKMTAQALMKWNIGFPRKLRVTQYHLGLHKITERYTLEIAALICKRLMLQTAHRIAEAENAEGIVTGDVLGKKATQTIHSLRFQDEAVKGFPVYRPLIGLDKSETAEAAKIIGLKKTSKEEIRQLKPEATVKYKEIKKIQRELKVERLVEEALKTLQILEL